MKLLSFRLSVRVTLNHDFLLKDCNLSFVKIVGDNHHSTIITDAFGNKIKGIAFNTVNEDMGNFFQDFSGEIVDIVVTLKDNFWE